MKKLLTLLIAGAMALSLTACGGVDLDKATETFNSANTQLNTLGEYANENVANIDQGTMDELQAMANSMGEYKSELESEDVTQERVDEITEELKNYPAKISEMETKVKNLIENAPEPVSQEDIDTLIAIVTELDSYNMLYTQYYDNFDDETKALADEISKNMNELTTALTSEEVVITDIDSVITGAQMLLEGAKIGWEGIAPQLGIPVDGEGMQEVG